MKRQNSENIEEIIAHLIGENENLKKNYYEFRLRNSFFEVAGENLMPMVKSIKIERRMLIVDLKSAALRSELNMMKESLTKALNEKVGVAVIDGIFYR